jgi:hypothetical protein
MIVKIAAYVAILSKSDRYNIHVVAKIGQSGSFY